MVNYGNLEDDNVDQSFALFRRLVEERKWLPQDSEMLLNGVTDQDELNKRMNTFINSHPDHKEFVEKLMNEAL